jgi:hypothetical protein
MVVKDMAKCPHCKEPVTLDARTSSPSDRGNEVVREVKGFLKKEILYSCPHCQCVLGFGSFFGGLITGRP